MAVRVAVDRDPDAALAPRMRGGGLTIAGRGDEEIAGGTVIGPALVDLGADGELLGLAVLEDQRYWAKDAIAWELPARARPHQVKVLELDPAVTVEVRWDVGRKLVAILFGDQPEPSADVAATKVVAIGPRAYVAFAGDRLAGVLADLRGFSG